MSYHKIVFEDESLEIVNQEFNTWRTANPNYNIVSDTTIVTNVYTRTVVYLNGI